MQERGKEGGGLALGVTGHHLFGSAGKEQPTAPTTALGPHLDQMVRTLDYIQVMLNNQHVDSREIAVP